jgi:hypothetical protein
MRSFLIDPFRQEITEVIYSGKVEQICSLIDADLFDCARINKHGDGIFVDDEGLFAEDARFFLHSDYPNPLAGKGMVIGCDMETGESASAHTTLDELIEKVRWVYPIKVNGELTWIDA